MDPNTQPETEEGLVEDFELYTPSDLSQVLLESIADPTNSDPHFHANLFVHLLFCKYIPLFEVELPFDFKTGFEQLITALNHRFPGISAWDATKGHMGYRGTILHLILSNIYAPHCAFAGYVKDYFGYDLEASHVDISDYCISEQGLQELLPIIYNMWKIEPEFLDYYDQTAFESLIIMAKGWAMPQHLRAFQGKMMAVMKGTVVKPIQRVARSWFQRRLAAADVINRHCFEYVLHPDCPIRRRFLERSKQLAV